MTSRFKNYIFLIYFSSFLNAGDPWNLVFSTNTYLKLWDKITHTPQKPSKTLAGTNIIDEYFPISRNVEENAIANIKVWTN